MMGPYCKDCKYFPGKSGTCPRLFEHVDAFIAACELFDPKVMTTGSGEAGGTH